MTTVRRVTPKAIRLTLATSVLLASHRPRLKALRDRYADEIRRKFPKLPRRVSGYNLDDLLPENGFHVARALVGSEGTLGVIV